MPIARKTIRCAARSLTRTRRPALKSARRGVPSTALLTAPVEVRNALRRGLTLFEGGYGGKGLRPETVKWARLLAEGEPITREKAVKMRAWFARHTAAKAENAARKRDVASPANVAYLLWGGTSAIAWSRRVVRAFGK